MYLRFCIYNGHKMKFGSGCKARKLQVPVQLWGVHKLSTPSSSSSSVHFWCFLCIYGRTSLTMQLNVIAKFNVKAKLVFLHQSVVLQTSNCFMQENTTRFNLSIFGPKLDGWSSKNRFFWNISIFAASFQKVFRIFPNLWANLSGHNYASHPRPLHI